MGWVRTRRDSKGGFSFMEVNDGSCLSNLQVLAEKDLPNYESEVLKLQTGCSVAVTGTLAASPGKGPEGGAEGGGDARLRLGRPGGLSRSRRSDTPSSSCGPLPT